MNTKVTTLQWAAMGWGLGLIAHGLSVFAFNGAFGKDWEERKIREYLDRHPRLRLDCCRPQPLR